MCWKVIPSVLMVIEELPLTASGKVDRRRLPEVETSRAELRKEYEGAGTEAERVLVSIWEEVLKVDGVGIHDNFFELGGDSILGLQIVARANQKGLYLQPKQLFKHQTIAELAASVTSGAQVLMAEQGLVTGDVPLTPIQKWFFEAQPVEPHHFNQAALFEVQEGADYALVKRAVEHLFEHHDALRLRFVPGETGWRQLNAGLEEAVPFTLIDLSKLSDEEQRERVEASAAQAQSSLHLTQGPLARVVLFEMGQNRPARLLIVVHHLAVDGMSWRILLEDLQTAYGQLSRGEALKLPRKTTSYKQWAERLEAYAVSDGLSKEAPYWLDERRKHVGKLPLDQETGANTVGSVRKVFASLDEEETRALLQEVPAAYRTKVNDALLTALAQTFARWSGERRLLVNVEGHGREEIGEAVDLSRTVGWFTTIFPVLLELGEALAVGEALKLVKEQLREIPQNGIGYGVLRYLREDEISAMLRELPPAEVLFNYLGQFDSVLSGSKLLRVADEASGLAQGEQERRRHALEIDLSVSHGQLRMTWSYSEHLHRRSTIEWLAAEYGDALRELIRHCQAPQSGGFTPADFPSAKLSQKELDKFLGKFKPRGGRSK